MPSLGPAGAWSRAAEELVTVEMGRETRADGQVGQAAPASAGPLRRPLGNWSIGSPGPGVPGPVGGVGPKASTVPAYGVIGNGVRRSRLGIRGGDRLSRGDSTGGSFRRAGRPGSAGISCGVYHHLTSPSPLYGLVWCFVGSYCALRQREATIPGEIPIVDILMHITPPSGPNSVFALFSI